jgi:hypothetical protein
MIIVIGRFRIVLGLETSSWIGGDALQNDDSQMDAADRDTAEAFIASPGWRFTAWRTVDLGWDYTSDVTKKW